MLASELVLIYLYDGYIVHITNGEVVATVQFHVQ